MNDQPEIKFSAITILVPGMEMYFRATPERIGRMVAFLIKEASESEIEFQLSVKPKINAKVD